VEGTSVVAVIAASVAVAAIAIWVAGRGTVSSDQPKFSAIPGARGLPTPRGRIVGYVRDVNGRPVPGARVRLMGGRQSVRTSRSGVFDLRAQPGRHMVVADHPAYTRQSILPPRRRGRGVRVDFSLAVTAPDRVSVPNSADRLLVWIGCDELVELSDRELRRWIGRGVDGFVCQARQLRGMGGDQAFTSRRGASLRGEEYRLQRRLRRSPAVRRARDGKLLLYLGFYMTNYFNPSTPLRDWFDDHGWSRVVLPAVRDVAAAARSMGFAGIAVDQELYAQQGGASTASWSWHYPGNRRSEGDVRAKARARGRQLMATMVRAFPQLEVVAYDTQLPETWEAKVAEEVHAVPNPFADGVGVDFWDGLSSVEGYSAIRWLDAVFYKTVHLFGASWDTALEYNANRIYSYLSRRFSNWAYASSRLHVSPFSWIDAGPSPFTRARPPEYVADQLDAFRKWAAGGVFANYAYRDLREFDYRPYDDALRRAGRVGRVDRRPPKLVVTSSPPETARVAAGETVSLTGLASDDYAIRAVRWYDDRGHEGIARLTWTSSGDQRSGWNGKMNWSIENLTIPRDAHRLTISAEDIKGLATELQLTVTR
jgi:Carboxypeptidase regulatory-like domain